MIGRLKGILNSNITNFPDLIEILEKLLATRVLWNSFSLGFSTMDLKHYKINNVYS